MSAPDVDFVRAIVEDAATVIDIDPDRVYAAGMSNGGGMAGRIACEASDLIAAVGVVAAAHGPGACVQERPVPVIAFHGDADRIVPLDGFPFVAQPIAEWVADRARANGCDAEPVVTEVTADVTLAAWDGCESDVRYYLVAGGRHGWPGSDRAGRVGDSTTTIDATALMWEFFSERPRP
jgi:polyhydroxybutyrate depolymerase